MTFAHHVTISGSLVLRTLHWEVFVFLEFLFPEATHECRILRLISVLNPIINKALGIKTVQPYCLKAVLQRKYIAQECLKPVFYKFNGHVIVAEHYKKEED